jgi:hypothetical protein
MTNSDFNYQDFCISLREITDRRDVPLENERTLDFLEAMTAWLDDTKGGAGFFENRQSDCISWSDLVKLIRASTMYE